MHHHVPLGLSRPVELPCLGGVMAVRWVLRQRYQYIFANITIVPMNAILFIVCFMSYSEGQQGSVMQLSGLAVCKEIATNLLMPLGKSNEKWQHSCHWEKIFPR